MSDKTSGEIVVLATPLRVSQVLADIADYPSWADGMSAPKLGPITTAGQIESAEFQIAAGPIRDTVEFAYEWAENCVSWRLVRANSLKSLAGSYRWQAVEGGTRVRYELELELVTALPSMLRKIAEKTIITTALQGLKRKCES